MLFFLFAGPLVAEFDSMECLNASFETEISRQAAPFGLTRRILGLSKERCVITIDHRKWKFYHERWIIDVCREPVHIKKGTGTISVIRKKGRCPKETPFCQELSHLQEVIADDGLIFAQGEKDDLTADHGQIYCSYLLVKKYLEEGIALSRSRDDFDIFPPSLSRGTPAIPCEPPLQSKEETAAPITSPPPRQDSKEKAPEEKPETQEIKPEEGPAKS